VVVLAELEVEVVVLAGILLQPLLQYQLDLL
jgi:hypothetical protein